MRQERTVQASIFDLFAQHEIGCELKKASTWLEEHPALLGLAQLSQLMRLRWVFEGCWGEKRESFQGLPIGNRV